MATSAEVDEFTEKIEKEFLLVSLVSSCGSNGLEDARTWIVDSGSSRHMTRIRDVFLSISKTGPDRHVESGVDTVHAVRGVGHVKF